MIKKNKIILKLWNETLGINKSNAGDNFFDLGGNSILSVKLLSKIKKEIGITILLHEFMDNPTQEYLLEKIDGSPKKETKSQNSESSWLKDARTTFNIPTNINFIIDKNPAIKHVMLTGATGFLGAHVLSDLLNMSDTVVHCLVRGLNHIDSIQKLKNTLNYYDINFDESRIKVYSADLSKPSLDLPKKVLNFLEKTIDYIYHVGAEVNHLYSYNKLRDTNVLGTLELIKLSNNFKKKPLLYISTINVASTTQSSDTLLKNWAHTPPDTNEGYTLTKWVSEEILYNSWLKTGIPIKILRPGNISGHSITGVSNPNNNHILLLLKGCIQLGYAPNWDFPIEMVPVDILAKAIVEESFRREKNNKFSIYNLHSPFFIGFQELIKNFSGDKYDIRIVEEEIWKKSLSMINENNSLYYLKSLYIENEEKNNMPLNKIKTNLLDILKDNASIQNIRDSKKLTSLYRTYLNSIGYI